MPPATNQHTGVAQYIQALKGSPRFGPQVAHHEELAGCDARFAGLSRPLPPSLGRAFRQAGFSHLFSHQKEAVDRIRDGRDVIVAAPSASGKSLIYNIPVITSYSIHYTKLYDRVMARIFSP